MGGAKMAVNEFFPTDFAVALAEGAKLVHKLKKNADAKDHEKYRATMSRLQEFQNLSISLKFEDCLICYYGKELNDDQKEVLKVIHKHTRPYVHGKNTDILLAKLSNGLLSGKDAKDITQAINDFLQPDGGGEKSRGRFIVNLTRE